MITIESSFDYECPFIDEVIIATNHKSAEFIFSEDMQISNILDLDNYLLETPIVDPDNRIIDVSYINNNNSFTVRLAFATALKPSNEGYYLHLENLVDLAGNPMHLADKVHHFNLTDIDDLEHLIVYPNPLVYSKIAVEEECSFRFLNLPRKQRGKICVFDVAGDLVFEDNFGPYYNMLDHYRWNAKNNNNRRISSGMYFFMIEMDGKVKKGKLAIIN